MNKHTKRYFYEYYDCDGEEISLDALAEAIRNGGESYCINDAINSIEDEDTRKLFKTEYIKSQYKFGG